MPNDAEIGHVIQAQFPGSRENCDREAAGFLTDQAALLLQSYDIVLRVDIDEFLVIDPSMGTWDDFKAELGEADYLYAIGLDLIHNTDVEPPYDPAKPILSQRSHAQFSGGYCKPHAISRPVTWTSACHSIEDAPVQLSKYLYMFHLAGMDFDLSLDRISNRGDLEKGSYAAHARRRMRDFETVKTSQTYPLDDRIDLMRERVLFGPDGKPKMSPRIHRINGKRSINIIIPERFSQLV